MCIAQLSYTRLTVTVQGLLVPLTAADISEDCLNINIIRPAGISSDAKLPVLAWIHGGGLLGGSSREYNGTGIVTQSILMVCFHLYGHDIPTEIKLPLSQQKEPVIYVSFNYRIAAFGFLASAELEEAAKEGSAVLNAGLYDMKLALEWVQANIDRFGGDKTKVSIEINTRTFIS